AFQVAGQRADFLVGQPAGDVGHDPEHRFGGLAAGAVAEGLQALLRVGGELATHVRVGRARVAAAGGAMAGHAGRDATVRVAAAVRLLADLVAAPALVRAFGHQAVVGHSRARLLAGEPGPDVTRV